MSIESIAARVEAATEGPWAKGYFDGDAWWIHEAIDGPDDVRVAYTSMMSDGEDTDFIAHARQDIPALLAVAEAVKVCVPWGTFPELDAALADLERML
jgi:hypothetical protein